ADLVDADYVYSTDPGSCAPGSQRAGCFPTGGKLRRVPRCGGTPEIIDPGPELVAALLDGGSGLYAIREVPPFHYEGAPEYGAFGVVGIDKATASIQELRVPPAVLGNTFSFAASSSSLFYYELGKIRSFSVGADRPDTWSLDVPSNVGKMVATE